MLIRTKPLTITTLNRADWWWTKVILWHCNSTYIFHQKELFLEKKKISFANVKDVLKMSCIDRPGTWHMEITVKVKSD